MYVVTSQWILFLEGHRGAKEKKKKKSTRFDQSDVDHMFTG